MSSNGYSQPDYEDENFEKSSKPPTNSDMRDQSALTSSKAIDNEKPLLADAEDRKE